MTAKPLSGGVLVVAHSDHHVGSTIGLAPPKWRVTDGDNVTEKRQSSLQSVMWKHWELAWKRAFDVGLPVVGIDVADNIDGDHHGTYQIWSKDPREQADVAVNIFQPKRVKCTRWYAVRGTPAHVGQSGTWDEYIAQQLSADHFTNHAFSNYQLRVEVSGVLFDVTHHGPSPGRRLWALGDVARKYAQDVILRCLTRHERPPDVIIRCLSEDTEILTSSGWKSHSNISTNDIVLTLNRDTNKLEWNQIQAITSRKTDEDMIRVKAKGYDVLVTPDHTMIYHPMSSNVWLSKEANQLSSMSTFRLPVSGYMEDIPGVDISDGILKLLAWVIAEGNMDNAQSPGHTHKTNVRLFQRISRADNLESIIRESGIPYTKNLRKQRGQKIIDGKNTYYTREDGYVFYLRQPYSQQIATMLNGSKNIPDWLMNMDNRQFEMFLSEYVKGDGYLEQRINHQGHQGRIFTANKDLADRFQILLLRNGYKSHIFVRPKWGKSYYVISFTKRQDTVIVTRRAFERLHYNGLIWCVSVPNGTIVTRRNGKVAILGNSHVHVPIHEVVTVADHTCHMIVTPAWQLKTEFSYRVATTDDMAQIGFATLKVCDGVVSDVNFDLLRFKQAASMTA